MYFFIISCVLWFFQALLLGQEPQESTPSLVNMTAMPSSIVAGVNVISGDYIEYEEDDEVGEVVSMTSDHEVIAICTGTDLYFVMDMDQGKFRSY